MKEKFIGTPEVAEMFCVTTQTVVNWIKGGLIGGWQTPGGFYRVRLLDVIKLQKKATLQMQERVKSND